MTCSWIDARRNANRIIDMLATSVVVILNKSLNLWTKSEMKNYVYIIIFSFVKKDISGAVSGNCSGSALLMC